MEYLDFDLEVAPGKTGKYAVSVVQSPAGEAHAAMRFPYDRLALKSKIQALQIALLRSGGSRRAVSTEDRSVEDLGRDLYQALFAGDIGNRLQVSRTIARQQGCGLRIRLRISTPELLGLPWEYLYDPTAGDYLALALSTPVIRYLPIAQPIIPLEVKPPLRILAMTAGPRDLGDLDVQRERERLDTAVERLQQRGLIDLKWVQGERWEDLLEALWAGPWHVFHYVGHGGFSRRLREGVLYLTGDDGNARELAAHDLARLLGDQDPLRLAVLNSCETAEGTETDIFSSTAAALVRRGTPAVVGMQFEITDDAAIQFSRTFYSAVAYGMPVDAAVAAARKAVSLEIPGTYEWGTPVLFMRSPDGVLFDVKATAQPNDSPIDATVAEVGVPVEPTPSPAQPDETARRTDLVAAVAIPAEPPPSTSLPSSPAAPAETQNVVRPMGAAIRWEPKLASRAIVPVLAVLLIGGVAILGAIPLLTGYMAPPPPSSTGPPSMSPPSTSPPSVAPPTVAPLQISITLRPKSGLPGRSFTVAGAGFVPGDTIAVSWGGGKYQETTSAASDGSFQITMTVPVGAGPGSRQIVATDSSGRTTSAFFQVVPSPATPSVPVATAPPTATPFRPLPSLHLPLPSQGQLQ